MRKTQETYWATFAGNLSFMLQRYNITQKTLADDLYLSQANISQYIHQQSRPSVDNLFKICGYFGITMDNLFQIVLDEQNYTEYVRQTLPTRQNMTNNDITNARFANKKFFCYYFNSSTLKEPSLREGTLHTGDITNTSFIEVNAELSKYQYTGKLLLNSASYIYIYAECIQRQERCFVSLNKPVSYKPYVGGLGLSISNSTGKKIAPCFRKIIISTRRMMPEDKNDLIQMLRIECTGHAVHLDEDDEYRVYKLIKRE